MAGYMYNPVLALLGSQKDGMVLQRHQSPKQTCKVLRGGLQDVLKWASERVTGLSLDRSAFLLDMLQRASSTGQGRIESLRMSLRIMPAVVQSMWLRIPSLEAWQALTEACAEALINCHRYRSAVVQALSAI